MTLLPKKDSQEKLDAINKSIDDYNATVGDGFVVGLENLLQAANERKSKEPKSEKTRCWAVVATDLEKVLAYAEKHLKE